MRTASDHQANDVVGTLLVQTVFVIVDSLDLLLLVTRFAHEPAVCGRGQDAVRERIAEFEPGNDRERVSCILLAPKDRKRQLADEHMADFMDHRKNDIARNELDAVAPLLFGLALEARVVRGFSHGRIHACPEACLERWPGLCGDGQNSNTGSAGARPRLVDTPA